MNTSPPIPPYEKEKKEERKRNSINFLYFIPDFEENEEKEKQETQSRNPKITHHITAHFFSQFSKSCVICTWIDSVLSAPFLHGQSALLTFKHHCFPILFMDLGFDCYYFPAYFIHILFLHVDFTPLVQIELCILLHWSILSTSFYYMNECSESRGIIWDLHLRLTFGLTLGITKTSYGSTLILP